MAKVERSPVVTIMGHVDHGKTTLLDTIRKTKVAAGETGGITQHIGAYQLEHKGKKITFIDTPGHAAFSSMRSRGANVTDIVILVVAATEGVKPQTVESIQHIKKAGVSYIVALTKMDLPDANIEMVKAQLTEHEVFVEGYGGDIVAVPVSAKSGEGVDKLLEMITLVSEMQELTADPDGELDAVVIESNRDPGKGAIATVLVRNGTLSQSQTIFADAVECKVRALFNERGEKLKEAGPSTPVEVIGWSEVPSVGAHVSTIKSIEAPVIKELPVSTELMELDKPKLKLILKSDVAGTLEAIEQSLGDDVILISKGVGNISDSDVLLADATKSKIVGFRVKVSGSIQKQAEAMGVKIKIYDIIYDLLESLQKQILKIIEPTIDEQILGTAEVIAIFDMKGERVAGCKIKSGEISKNQLYHLKRADVIIADPKLKSLKRGKEDLETAKEGTECGMVFRHFSDISIGDVIVSYKIIDE